MDPLSYFIAFVCISLGFYYWYTNNQLKAQVEDSKRTDIPRAATANKSTEKCFDFDSDCKIRLLGLSDLDSVKKLVKSDGGCNYFKDHSLEPFLNESNKECFGFCVELIQSKSIVCTQFISMVDSNETGLVLGAMIDNAYSDDARIIYMRLSNDVQAQLSNMFDHLGKYRSVEIGNKDSYMNNASLDWKIKFNLDVMSGGNVYYLLENTGENKDNLDGIKVNGDFKECEDIDKVISVFEGFGINDVLIDWRLFQVKCLGNELEKAMKNNTVSVMVNHDYSGVCVVYGNSDYYIYGATAKNVLSGIRFVVSRNSGDSLGGIFVRKSVVDSDDYLKKIFGKAVESPIVCLDYDMHIDGH